MSDLFSKAKRSQVMAAIRSRGNRSTELRAISIFKKFQIKGWRRHYRIAGKPDFAFPKSRVAVFIDGCFWHGCSRCYDGHLPKSNQDYWRKKIAGNIRRDHLVDKQLQATGWKILRITECQLPKERTLR